jgi:predicted nucleic acid-binding Zn ribbon protein
MGAAMNRFVHRFIMSMLLVAVLVLVWNVLGSR